MFSETGSLKSLVQRDSTSEQLMPERSLLLCLLLLPLLSGVGCREKASTAPAETGQSAVPSEEDRVATLREHFGTINVQAWPAITSDTIGELVSAAEVQAIHGQGGQTSSSTNAAGNGQVYQWLDDEGQSRQLRVEIPMTGLSESRMMMQVAARRNAVQRRDMQEIDLTDYGVAGFWNSGTDNDLLTICCRHQLIGIDTEQLIAANQMEPGENRRVALAMARKLFESAKQSDID